MVSTEKKTDEYPFRGGEEAKEEKDGIVWHVKRERNFLVVVEILLPFPTETVLFGLRGDRSSLSPYRRTKEGVRFRDPKPIQRPRFDERTTQPLKTSWTLEDYTGDVK